jgi:hemolysin activation/secretion protein
VPAKKLLWTCGVSNPRIIVAGCASLCLALSAQAQDAGARQQSLQREIDQRRSAPSIATPAQKKAKDIKPQEVAKPQLFVKKFKITGVSLITQAQAQAAVEGKLNQSLTFEQIQEAAQSVADLYSSIGRIAVAVIPEQDVVDGTIEIRIIEAKVGSVLIQSAVEGSPLRLRDDVAKAFISKGNDAGQFLSLGNLNRSKALLNDLPGVNAQVALSKSQADGSSNIQVSLQEGSLFTGRADVSNSGSASTGVLQNMWSLNLNNPSGLGDAATLDLALSQGSTFSTAKYWVPVGYDGWRVAPGVSALSYRSLSSFSNTISNGNANVAGLYSTYALKREGADTSSLNFSVENKKYHNFSNDAETSAYGISKFNAGVSGALLGEKQNLSYAVTAGLGNLNINNAAQLTNDQSQSGAQTSGRFSKLSLNLNFNSSLPIKNTSARLSLNGQVASKNLNSSEQLYLGGPDGVRAYPVAQGGGSQGYVTSLELTHFFENGLQLGVFFDVGVIQQYKTNWSTSLQGSTQADNIYSLRATGLTAKYGWNNFQLQAALAYRLGQNPLHTSTGAQLNSDNAYRSVQAWVKGTYSFN